MTLVNKIVIELLLLCIMSYLKINNSLMKKNTCSKYLLRACHTCVVSVLQTHNIANLRSIEQVVL